MSYLNGQWDRNRSRHLKYVYRCLTASTLNKAHKDVSNRITSFLCQSVELSFTISYDLSVEVFVKTDRTTVETLHQSLFSVNLIQIAYIIYCINANQSKYQFIVPLYIVALLVKQPNDALHTSFSQWEQSCWQCFPKFGYLHWLEQFIP